MLVYIPGRCPAYTGTEARGHRSALATEAHKSNLFSSKSIHRVQGGNFLYSVPVLDNISSVIYPTSIKIWQMGSEYGRAELEYGRREIGPLIVFGEDGEAIDPSDVNRFYRAATEDGMISLWYMTEPVESIDDFSSSKNPRPELPDYVIAKNRQLGFTVLYIKNDEAGNDLLGLLEERRRTAIDVQLGKDKGAYVIPPIQKVEGNNAVMRFTIANHISEKMLLPDRIDSAVGGYPTCDCLRMLTGGFHPDDLDEAGPLTVPGLMPLVVFYECENVPADSDEIVEYLRDDFLTRDLDATLGYIAQRGAGAGLIPLPDSLYLDAIMETMRKQNFYLLPIPLLISNPRRFFIRQYFERKGTFIYYN
jgi:hypothetical protein